MRMRRPLPYAVRQSAHGSWQQRQMQQLPARRQRRCANPCHVAWHTFRPSLRPAALPCLPHGTSRLLACHPSPSLQGSEDSSEYTTDDDSEDERGPVMLKPAFVPKAEREVGPQRARRVSTGVLVWVPEVCRNLEKADVSQTCMLLTLGCAMFTLFQVAVRPALYRGSPQLRFPGSGAVGPNAPASHADADGAG